MRKDIDEFFDEDRLIDNAPVTFFVAPDQGVVVTRPGMTCAPSRRHDPGVVSPGLVASRDR
ncbi:hypothetical protein [Amycolatopsis sp. NPDC051102]|uniref:hypothetical protein n=1 Tax=Amycolatopsis sp. NPDC051102 TaxID=3155163 RepID=UPI0034165411